MLSNDNWKYLSKAGVVPEEMVRAEVGANWHEVLSFPEIPDYYRTFIRYFLLPFNISGLKYSFNLEYIQQEDTVRDLLDHEEFGKDFLHIAPTLRKLLQEKIIIQSTYPFWFLAAFPDVAFWALQGEGLKIITQFTDVSKHLNFELEEITMEQVLLIAHIKVYLEKTGNKLECIWYNAP